MADEKRPTPAEDPTFETDTVKANRAVENGQGLGAREIAAQRDPGGVNTADEEAEADIGASARGRDGETLDQTVGRDDDDGSARADSQP